MPGVVPRALGRRAQFSTPCLSPSVLSPAASLDAWGERRRHNPLCAPSLCHRAQSALCLGYHVPPVAYEGETVERVTARSSHWRVTGSSAWRGSTRWSRLGPGPACALVTKIFFDRELSDLREQHLAVSGGIGTGRALAKEGRGLIDQLPTPLRDLIGMDLVFGRDLVDIVGRMAYRFFSR